MKNCEAEVMTAGKCFVCGLLATNELPVAFVVVGKHEEFEECADCWLSAEGVAYSPEAVAARMSNVS